MPLLEGKSREVIAYNISELIRSGKPRKQAIAIAFKKSRKKRRKKRK